MVYDQDWPELYIYTVIDRIFGDFLAQNTVCAPYTYGSGQPYAKRKARYKATRIRHKVCYIRFIRQPSPIHPATM
jgi:hypothetical protein